MMTVRDLLKMEVDIDVVDDVTEELYVAFCGPQKLTAEGEKHFAEVLDYEVTLHGTENVLAVIHVDDEEDAVWEERLRKASELFYGMAGDCSIDDYRKWFETEV